MAQHHFEEVDSNDLLLSSHLIALLSFQFFSKQSPFFNRLELISTKEKRRTYISFVGVRTYDLLIHGLILHDELDRSATADRHAIAS